MAQIQPFTGEQLRNAERDRLFIQEIINDLERNGYVPQGKAHTMLRDWSGELRVKTGMQGRTKRVFMQQVGKYLW